MPDVAHDPAPDAPRWGVLVIHGVGDTRPGATLDAFVPPLLATDPTLRLDPVPGPGVVRLPDEPPGLPSQAEHVEMFPVHLKYATRKRKDGTPERVTFAEVYWADLSTTRGGTLHLLWGLVQAIFSLRYITDQAAAQPSLPARWLRFTLFIVSSLLLGPIAALNAMMALTMLVRFALGNLLPGLQVDVSEGELVVEVLTLLGVAVGGCLLTMGRARGWGRGWQVFWLCFMLAGPCAWLLLRSDVITPPGGEANVPAGIRYAAALLYLMRWLYFALCAIMLVAGIFWAWARMAARGERGPGLTAAYATALLEVALWVLLVPAVLLIGRRVMPQATGPIDKLLDSVFLAFVFHLALGMVVVLSALGTWGARSVRVRRDPSGFESEDWTMPRLIVGRAILACLILTALAATLLTVALFLARLGVPGVRDAVAWFEKTAAFTYYGDKSMAIVAGLASIAVVLTATLARPLREGLHILMDVINHFYIRGRDVPWPWVKHPACGEPGYEEYMQKFIRRCEIQQRIESRCERVLDYLLSGGITHLVVVAHSQGTIIAVDVLAKHRTAASLQGLREVRLVTMGSPLSHLYQHYFPERYPPLADGSWRNLWKTVRRWLNLYRCDDFVGMQVVFPKGSPGKCKTAQHGLPRGGHTGYWNQRMVLDFMRDIFHV